MTILTLNTTMDEANDIAKKDKCFVFRGVPAKKGDTLIFKTIFNGKEIPHEIDKMRFRVTYATNDAPVEKGFWAIGFKRASHR